MEDFSEVILFCHAGESVHASGKICGGSEKTGGSLWFARSFPQIILEQQEKQKKQSDGNPIAGLGGMQAVLPLESCDNIAYFLPAPKRNDKY